jgi:23S rRNA (adenine-N6)-dimethyltransferase
VAAGSPRWGWHELDSRWAARLAALADVGPGDLVLDIGAGSGRLTAAALRRGAGRVVAVELHAGRAAALQRRFAGDPRVRVVRADASDLRLPARPFKVVANPPFGLTTSLLRRLTSGRSALDSAALVLPAWAVGRWSSGRGARCAPRFGFAPGPWVPPRAFTPPSPCASRTLVIRTA